MPGLGDFHSHLIPGVDDGAADIAESRTAIAAMARAGITRIVTSPHLDAELTLDRRRLDARLTELDRGWAELDSLARSEFPEVTIRRGTELNLDVPDPDLSDARLRLDGGPFVLIEFPGMMVPPNSSAPLARLVDAGFVPIVAHPERYHNLDRRLAAPRQWLEAGALLQVNYRSITGGYDGAAKDAARTLLKLGWVSYLSSDFHCRGDVGVAEAQKLFGSWNAAEQFRLLTEVNPGLMMDGKMPLDVPPFETRAGIWEYLKLPNFS